jgi:hypothetical protein
MSRNTSCLRCRFLSGGPYLLGESSYTDAAMPQRNENQPLRTLHSRFRSIYAAT